MQRSGRGGGRRGGKVPGEPGRGAGRHGWARSRRIKLDLDMASEMVEEKARDEKRYRRYEESEADEEPDAADHG